MSGQQGYTATSGYATWADDAIRDAALLVEDGVIIAFGTRAEVEDIAAYDCEWTDLGDVVLAPGFIDGHVHLHFDGSADPIAGVTERTDADLAALAERNAALLVGAGVTTARDLGSRGTATTRTRERITAGEIPGPRLLLAGSPVTSARGHCWFLGGECASTAEMIELVHAQADAGADWVKIMVSGGFLTEASTVSQPQFDVAALSAVVAYAHARGLRVSAHAHSTQAVRAAALAGVDTIEHSTFIAPDTIDFDPEVVAALVSAGVAVCPTVNAATSSYPAEFGIDALARLRIMNGLGVDVLMGTDAGVANVTGDLYAAGLAMLVAAGFGEREVLGFATAGAARILGVDDSVGTLSSGRRADAVALRADPTSDIGAAADPAWVLAAGRVVDRAAGTVGVAS